MNDSFGRIIDYVRISVTDKCNLRCKYCMPVDVDHYEMKDILTFEEIEYITSCMAGLGISRVKLTGGEPLVRRGVCDLVGMLKRIEGIRQVTLTTNGILLKENLHRLIEAGIDAINVSIDSLDHDKYFSITGSKDLDTVTDAVVAAVEKGIKVKINAVTAGISLTDVRNLIEFSRSNKIDVRFIELMPIGYAKCFDSLAHDRLMDWFCQNHPDAVPVSADGNGPAKYYRIPGYDGKVGFISPLSDKFCNSCNRIRLTTRGYLKSCLCYDTGVDLMPLVRSDSSEEKKRGMLCTAIRKAIMEKPSGHDFTHTQNITEKLPMSAIGG